MSGGNQVILRATGVSGVVNEGYRPWDCDHEWKEFIDPSSGGFMRCMKCGRTVDCEDPDGDIGG